MRVQGRQKRNVGSRKRPSRALASQLGLDVMTVRREGKFSLQVVAKEVCRDSATVSMPLVAIGIAR